MTEEVVIGQITVRKDKPDVGGVKLISSFGDGFLWFNDEGSVQLRDFLLELYPLEK